MHEFLTRVWDNLVARSDGPLDLRLFLQPVMASLFAIRAGIRDARAGKPAFFWAMLRNPELRRELVQEGWKDVGKVFILAMILDAAYQIIVHRSIYPGEVLITAIVLALIPYIILRGPVNRIARMAMDSPAKTDGDGKLK